MHAWRPAGSRAREKLIAPLREEVSIHWWANVPGFCSPQEAHIYGLSWELSILPPFATYATCHHPNKCFIQGQQASSAIPQIPCSSEQHSALCFFLAEEHWSCKCSIYRPSPARLVKQPAIRLYQRAQLPGQFVLLQEIWKKHCTAIYHLQSH